MPTNTRPEISDENETVIEFHGRPGSLGRRTFTAYWLADNTGPHGNETGVHGQVFCMDPEAFADRVRGRGRAVRLLEVSR